MTPTELDAIFRAWRDDWFAKNPDKSDWLGPEALLIDSLAFGIEGIWAYNIARAVLLHASATDQARPYGSDKDWLILRPAAHERFLFADPPPLPAGVPIPFPAGKALLEEVKRIPYPYSDGSIALRLVCIHHFPRWFDECPACKITASSR